MKITFEFPEITNPEKYLTEHIKRESDDVLYAYYLVQNNCLAKNSNNPEFNPEEYLNYILEDNGDFNFTSAKEFLPIIKAIHQLTLPNTRKLLIKIAPNLKAFVGPDEL